MNITVFQLKVFRSLIYKSHSNHIKMLFYIRISTRELSQSYFDIWYYYECLYLKNVVSLDLYLVYKFSLKTIL